MNLESSLIIVFIIFGAAVLIYLVTLFTSPGSGVLKKVNKRVNVFDESYQHMELYRSHSRNLNRPHRENLDIKYSEQDGTPTSNLPTDGYGKYKDQ